MLVIKNYSLFLEVEDKNIKNTQKISASDLTNTINVTQKEQGDANSNSKKILENASMEIRKNEIVVLTGKNGVGKSSFVMSLLGLDGYERSGSVTIDGTETIELKPYEIAKLGLFVSFQTPPEFEGVTLMQFLLSSFKHFNENNEQELKISNFKIRKEVVKLCKTLNLKEELLERGLNEGFSGGEKRKCEILQMLLLNPKVAILDEVDSGLDIESKEIIGQVLQDIRNGQYETLGRKNTTSFFIISHSNDFIEKIKPDRTARLENYLII